MNTNTEQQVRSNSLPLLKRAASLEQRRTHSQPNGIRKPLIKMEGLDKSVQVQAEMHDKEIATDLGITADRITQTSPEPMMKFPIIKQPDMSDASTMTSAKRTLKLFPESLNTKPKLNIPSVIPKAVTPFIANSRYQLERYSAKPSPRALSDLWSFHAADGYIIAENINSGETRLMKGDNEQPHLVSLYRIYNETSGADS